MNEQTYIDIDIQAQMLYLWELGVCVQHTAVSTALLGVGQLQGSFKTPLGLHYVRAKIGNDAPVNAVFVGRRQTGEIYTPQLREQSKDRDWILTRIMWLCGLEPGKNRLGNCDTFRRYIYIHGESLRVLASVTGLSHPRVTTPTQCKKIYYIYEQELHADRPPLPPMIL